MKSLVAGSSVGISKALLVHDDAALAERVRFVHEWIYTDSFAGAGGLGRELYVALSLFQGRRAAALILCILALGTAVDLLSRWLRGRLAGGAPPGAPGRAAAGEGIAGAAVRP